LTAGEVGKIMKSGGADNSFPLLVFS